MADLPFDNISGLVGLQVIEANSADELLAVIAQIRVPVQLVAVYAAGGRHYAWLRTSAKIKKQTQKSKEIK